MATPADAADPLVGHVFAERYRIDARLGEGGMGTVYRAYHTGLDCSVAVKLLHPALTSDPVVARRFDREAIALSKLDHPNCLRVLDAGTSPTGAKYIVMPLLDGQELRSLLGRPLPLARVIDLTTQILRGLEHAHRRGMIHRDLKPENVLVVIDDEGRELAKLVDFGIVKLLVEDAGAEPLTRAGLVFGTPRYMSPEQVSGGAITARTDLYALGIMLFELLTGDAPFDADDAGMLMRMQILGDVPELPTSVPVPIAEIVRRLLEKSPGDRFQSACEVREALETAMLAAPGRTVMAPPAEVGLTAIATSPTEAAPAPPPPVATPLPTFGESTPPSSRAQSPVALAMAPMAETSRPRTMPRHTRLRVPILAAILLVLLGITMLVVLWPEPKSPAAVSAPAPASGPSPSVVAPKTDVAAPPVVSSDMVPATAPVERERTRSGREKERPHGKGHGHDKARGHGKGEKGKFKFK